jgi:hypothetical protein
MSPHAAKKAAPPQQEGGPTVEEAQRRPNLWVWDQGRWLVFGQDSLHPLAAFVRQEHADLFVQALRSAR